MIDDELLTFIFRIIIVPLFICYIFAVDYLFMCHAFREAFTLIFIVFSLNSIFQHKYLTKLWRDKK